jgi:hypothetical protein
MQTAIHNDTLVHYLGLTGGHGLGKSSFANELEARFSRYHDVKVVRLNMADKLREQFNSSLPFSLRDEKQHPLERPALQYFGEIWRRQDKNIWVEKMLNVVPYFPYLYESDGDDPRVAIVIVADAYHFNEMVLMDQLVLVSNPSEPVDVGTGYQAASIRETRWALANAPVMRQLVGHVDSFQASTASEFNSPHNLDKVERSTIDLINRKFALLHLHPLKEPEHASSLDLPPPHAGTADQLAGYRQWLGASPVDQLDGGPAGEP